MLGIIPLLRFRVEVVESDPAGARLVLPRLECSVLLKSWCCMFLSQQAVEDCAWQLTQWPMFGWSVGGSCIFVDSVSVGQFHPVVLLSSS